MPGNRKTLIRKQQLALQTRLANDILNEFDPAEPGERDQNVCKKWRDTYKNAIRRTDMPSYGYNCHGLAFAARRTQVWNSVDVQHMISEDGYHEVTRVQALPGDVAIYSSLETREIEHSAIVIEPVKDATDLTGPRVISKWGPCEEYIHLYAECPYTPAEVKFYRMVK